MALMVGMATAMVETMTTTETEVAVISMQGLDSKRIQPLFLPWHGAGM